MSSCRPHTFLILLVGTLIGAAALFAPVSKAAERPKSDPSLLASIEVSERDRRVVISVRTTGKIERYTSFTLKNPARIVFDLFGIKSPYRKERSIPVNSPWVRQIRHYGDTEKLRIVLDTTEPYLSSFTAESVETGLTILIGPDGSAPPDPRTESASAQPRVPEQPKESEKRESEKSPGDARQKWVKSDIPDPMSIIGNRLDSPDTERPTETYTLRSTIDAAIAANLQLKISQEDTQAAQALKKRQKTFFYPTLGAQYQGVRNDEGRNIGGVALGSETEFQFSTTLRQPVFTGFALINQYKISSLGLDIAELSEKLRRQDVILSAKIAYFNLLKAQKLVEVAQKTVEQITAQREVAKNFYQVGMTPLNDFLQAQVELANAKQELIVARNNRETAISDFNTLLRRPLNARLLLEDISDYERFENTLEFCQKEAEKNRLEVHIAKLDVQRSEKEMELTRKDYYPSINLEGKYFKAGEDWYVNGGEGIFDPEGWSIGATASWDFWQWGRTHYNVREKASRLNQSKHQRDQLLDQIRQEVKQVYLKNLEAEINIVTIQTAIEQAEENLRINQERFKEQIATPTDVLIAQTLLTRTMTNFYNALYDFKISKAALYRAMGQEILE